VTEFVKTGPISCASAEHLYINATPVRFGESFFIAIQLQKYEVN
jgi:hypothetical protein